MTAPRVSVVLHGDADPEALRRCLASLGGQEAEPGSYEVLPPGSGTGAARGRVLLFLAADAVAGPRLVAEHGRAHEGGGRRLAIGRLTLTAAGDWATEAFAGLWNERQDRLAAGGAGWADCDGANFSVPAEALREAGAGAAPGAELAYRLHEAGCVPLFLDAAQATREERRRGPELLRAERRRAAESLRLAAAAPRSRAGLLHWFHRPTPREVCLRRLLLALRVPPRALAAAGRLLPGAGPRQLWFGFLARLAFWSAVRRALPRREWLRTTRGPAVLMYHAFGEGERDRYVLDRRRFARQMRLLKLLRYRVLSFGELARALRAGESLPARAAVITIDDGYRDNLELAAPILRRHGFPATLFVVSGRVGGRNDWDSEGAVAGRPLLDRGQLLWLRELGVELGAHTRSHPSLPDLDARQVEEEGAGSLAELAELLGAAPACFAFPFGRFDERSRAAVAAAGYEGCCTVEAGFAYPGTDPLLVPRIEVEGGDGPLRFLVKLAFAGG